MSPSERRKPSGARGSSSKGSARTSSSGRGSSSSGRSSAGRAASSSRSGSSRQGAAARGIRGRAEGRPAARREDPAGESVEGRQAVAELLRAGRRRVHHLTVSDQADRSGLLGEILDLAEGAGVPVRHVGRERLAAMAGTEAPQGVVALAEPLPELTLDDLLERAADPAFLVVLDGVTDPHNVGAVMRSALSAGAGGLILGRHRAAPLGPAAVKAAAGAVEWLPVATVPGVPAALGELRRRGVWTLGFDGEGSTSVWDLPVATEAVALVFGAEGHGLSPLSRARCEVVVSIPMVGPLGSLNVSAAAALGCFEVARRRGVAEPV